MYIFIAFVNFDPLFDFSFGTYGVEGITDEWGVEWGTYISSSRDIIYAKIDARGSYSQGSKLKNAVKYKLGTVESEDIVYIT